MKKVQKLLLKAFLIWLPFAAAITILCGLIYITVQQNFRMNANDPQIQIAEDTAQMLSSGSKLEEALPNQKVDIAKSLAPFVIIYSEDGKTINSSAVLNGTTPTLPLGVFEKTKQIGETRFTWQPAVGVRNAVVVVHYAGKNSGFVLAGRSLREVEIREAMLEIYVGSALVVALFTTAVTSLLAGFLL